MKRKPVEAMHDVKILQQYSTIRAKCYTEGCNYMGSVYALPTFFADRPATLAKAKHDAANHRARSDSFKLEKSNNSEPNNVVEKFGNSLRIIGRK